jgi:hypothetical protein
MILPPVIALSLTGDRKRRFFLPERLFWPVVAALTVVALYLTNSLGAWLAAWITTALLAVIYIRTNHGLRAAIGTGFIASLLSGAALWAAVAKTDAISTVNDRLSIWLGGMRALIRAPLLGTGPETMRFVMPNVQPLSLDPGEVFADAHNIFITLGATVGVFGLLAFLALLISLLASKPRAEADGLLLISLKLALVAYIIGHLFNPESIAPLALFWTIMGAVAGLTGNVTIRVLKHQALGSAALAGGFVLTLMVGLIGVNNWQAERYIKLADREPNIQKAWGYASTAQSHWPYSDFYHLFLFDRSTALIGRDPAFTSRVIASVDRALEHNRLSADAYYARGELHRILADLGDRDFHTNRAVSSYRTALKLNRLKLPANLELAKLYLRTDRARQAKPHLDLLLKVVPANDEHRPQIIGLRQQIK